MELHTESQPNIELCFLLICLIIMIENNLTLNLVIGFVTAVGTDTVAFRLEGVVWNDLAAQILLIVV